MSTTMACIQPIPDQLQSEMEEITDQQKADTVLG